MRTTLTLGVAALLLAGAAAAADDAGGASQLVGTYTIVAGEKFGQKEPADRVKDITVRFTDKEVVVTDKDKKQVYAASYKLATNQKPWRITMVSTLAPSAGQTAKGLIEKKGDTVRLIYAEGGGEMPTDFKTKDKQLMFVMKKK
jgi:uncharacterized protein (TIGR03067 family)